MSLMPRRFPHRHFDLDNGDGTGIDWAALRTAAYEAMQGAYAPYSNFPVGAAALVDDGRIVRGTNVENASYGMTLCAECGVVSQLHSTGGGRLIALACVDRYGAALMPCGRCRQLLWEHGGPEMLIASAEDSYPLSSLLPHAFGPADLASDSPHVAGPHGPAISPAAAPDPHLSAMLGQGTVFVHQDVAAGARVWTAYWDRSTGTEGTPQILDEAPGHHDVAEVIAWGLARTRRVVVIDADGAMYWAGEGPAPAEVPTPWSNS